MTAFLLKIAIPPEVLNADHRFVISSYLLHSGSPYPLWSGAIRRLYGTGPTATACCASR